MKKVSIPEDSLMRIFVEGDYKSLDDFSSYHGINLSKVKHLSTDEGWMRARKEYREKLKDRYAEVRVEKLDSGTFKGMQETLMKLYRKLEQSVDGLDPTRAGEVSNVAKAVTGVIDRLEKYIPEQEEVSSERFLEILRDIGKRIDAMNADSELCREWEIILSAMEEYREEQEAEKRDGGS